MKSPSTLCSMLALALVFCQLAVILGLAEDPKELGQLRFEFQVEMADLKENAPMQEFNGKYRGYLEKQKAAYQQEGKLEAMLAVEEELKSFEGEPGKELSTYPELKRLQGIYREQRQGLEKKKNEKKLTLFESYAKKANDLATLWTRNGKIEEAKLALAEARRFTAMTSDQSLLKTITTPAAGATAAVAAGGSSEDREAGEEMRNGIGMKLCWIPAGKFTMGSPEDEEGRDAAREAQVDVELTRGFWIGKYEVTQDEYEEVIGKNPSRSNKFSKRAPVDSVSWEDALAFCQKLTEQERKKGSLQEDWSYTLPTEARWEYSCRAGEAGRYSGGELGEVGWYKENSGGKTHEVGEKKPNAWGLHDMHGNVREWCLDWMSDELTGGKDPAVLDSGSDRVNHGGSWYNTVRGCRSALRGRVPPAKRLVDLGFRVCLTRAD